MDSITFTVRAAKFDFLMALEKISAEMESNNNCHARTVNIFPIMPFGTPLIALRKDTKETGEAALKHALKRTDPIIVSVYPHGDLTRETCTPAWSINITEKEEQLEIHVDPIPNDYSTTITRYRDFVSLVEKWAEDTNGIFVKNISSDDLAEKILSPDGPRPRRHTLQYQWITKPTPEEPTWDKGHPIDFEMTDMGPKFTYPDERHCEISWWVENLNAYEHDALKKRPALSVSIYDEGEGCRVIICSSLEMAEHFHAKLKRTIEEWDKAEDLAKEAQDTAPPEQPVDAVGSLEIQPNNEKHNSIYSTE